MEPVLLPILISPALLNTIHSPQDLRNLSLQQLQELAGELRDFIQRETRTKEGHIKSSLGVVELSIALHKVLSTPDDILIWDVGHQAYAHKILTGRREQFRSNRQKGGLSGFTKRSESPYDPFGAGHSSTSVSAAVGFAQSLKLQNRQQKVVAVIGDGAFTGGMCFEALNYLGQQQLDVLVILNDNESSIDDNVGALATRSSYDKFCASLGIAFEGDVDGHNLEELIPALERSSQKSGPRLLKVNTQKGRGWQTGEEKKPASKLQPSFQDVFASTLTDLMKEDQRIVAISPAMLSGSKLDTVREAFPDRVFDVGIAEQHAVTMAAGMAASGMIPVVHLYSTFSQRAYDQIIHDVALQKLPVIFCIDRAGLVGEDGSTHHGAFDTGFFNNIPNLQLAAPIDCGSFEQLLRKSLSAGGPFVIRYPKAAAEREFKADFENLRCLKEGKSSCVISYGVIGQEAAKAVEGTDFAHYDLMQLKPLPKKQLLLVLGKFTKVISVEENSLPGGVGESLLKLISEKKLQTRLEMLAVPDRFIEHGKRDELLAEAGIDAAAIQRALLAP